MKKEILKMLEQACKIPINSEPVEPDPYYVEPKPEELTCFDCKVKNCDFRGDSYNTNGDCLAEK